MILKNFIKNSLFCALALSFAVSAEFDYAPTQASTASQTLKDLQAIIPKACGKPAGALNTVEECNQIISSSDHELLVPLKKGAELFKIADKLEFEARQNGFAVWWRYSVETSKVKSDYSFGISLFAGYYMDGYTTYNNSYMFCGNASACTYVYYANSLMAKDILKNRLAFADELLKFVQDNNFLQSTPNGIKLVEDLITMKTDLAERYAVWQEKEASNQLANHIKTAGLTGAVKWGGDITADKRDLLEEKLTLNIISAVQRDQKYHRLCIWPRLKGCILLSVHKYI